MEVVVALSEALIWNLLGEEEKHKTLGQGSWNPSLSHIKIIATGAHLLSDQTLFKE
jgi:hypothetical protein